MSGLHEKTFALLLIAISLAFAWILWPYSGSILWAVIFAIVFAPVYRRLARLLRGKRTVAALLTLVTILLIVVLPLALMTAILTQEVLGVYARVQSGELDFARIFQHFYAILPSWITDLADRFDFSRFGQSGDRLSSGLARASQFVALRALSIGQNTFEFVVDLGIMLYLLFFLLRDGEGIHRRIDAAIPLEPDQRRALIDKFAAVIRSTIKGTVVVALAQGTLGGLMFWALGVHAPVFWGGLMALFSLLPAVGSALVWAPVAVYFLVSGAVWRGVILIVFGVLVIGLVDNVLRPVLVGKQTRIPDYIVLVATLGGIAIFGVNGFVIGPVIAAMFMAVWDIFSETAARA